MSETLVEKPVNVLRSETVGGAEAKAAISPSTIEKPKEDQERIELDKRLEHIFKAYLHSPDDDQWQKAVTGKIGVYDFPMDLDSKKPSSSSSSSSSTTGRSDRKRPAPAKHTDTRDAKRRARPTSTTSSGTTSERSSKGTPTPTAKAIVVPSRPSRDRSRDARTNRNSPRRPIARVGGDRGGDLRSPRGPRPGIGRGGGFPSQLPPTRARTTDRYPPPSFGQKRDRDVRDVRAQGAGGAGRSGGTGQYERMDDRSRDREQELSRVERDRFRERDMIEKREYLERQRERERDRDRLDRERERERLDRDNRDHRHRDRYAPVSSSYTQRDEPRVYASPSAYGYARTVPTTDSSSRTTAVAYASSSGRPVVYPQDRATRPTYTTAQPAQYRTATPTSSSGGYTTAYTTAPARQYAQGGSSGGATATYQQYQSSGGLQYATSQPGGSRGSAQYVTQMQYQQPTTGVLPQRQQSQRYSSSGGYSY